ncbi:MAG: hypothetical protein CMP30_04640 [Roseibacillus sp.]|nr:hypothetical protein [Roseibacillus sp.]
MSEFETVALLPGDMLAICMTALVSFALGMIATILFVMARSGGSPSNLEDDLLENEDPETSDRPHETARDLSEPPPPETWEKDSNWWKT